MVLVITVDARADGHGETVGHILQVFDIGNDVIASSLNEQSNEEKINPTKGSSLQGKSHTFTFKKLKDEKYTVVIRTLVNGRTVVRVSIFQRLLFLQT